MEAALAAVVAGAGGGPAAPAAAAGAGEAGRDNATRPAAAAAAATPEEEALKRNTDCVYFLASPLTCKKGADCEYRHSEGARVNPRDCYYWLNGNCLNPKCSFRHPPLEGLFGSATTSSGPLPPPQAALPTQAASFSSRQSVPCYYFQWGLCLKGDRCPFSHGLTPTANPAPQQTLKIATQVAESQQTSKKSSWTVEKCNQSALTDNVAIPAVAPTVGKRSSALGTGSTSANGLATKKNIQSKPELPSRPEINKFPINTGTTINRLQIYQSDLADQQLQNERDGDEFFHESSPGFDVLVDDENEDSGYYHNEDDYRDPSINDARSFKPVTDFDYGQNPEYENAGRFNRERHREEGECDDHIQLCDHYDREHRLSSSGRMVERASVPKRSRRGDTMSEVDGSDLRHRLLKQRRINGRSSASPDRPSELYRWTDRYTEEKRYHSRRVHDDQHQAPGRVSVSKRLQGRISLPGRMPEQTDASISDNAADTGRDWVGRHSVGKPSIHQERNRRQRSSEEFLPRERPGIHVLKNEEAEKSDFARPKSLSELKGAKTYGSSDHRSSRSALSAEEKEVRLQKALGNHLQTESASFEGPKSLSDILKRKREAAALSRCNEGIEADRGHNSVFTTIVAVKKKAVGSIDPLKNAAGVEEKDEGVIQPDNQGREAQEGKRQEGVVPTHEQGQEAQYYENADGNEDEYIEDPNGEYVQGDGEDPNGEYVQGDGEYEYEQNEEGEEYYYEDEEGVYQEGQYPEGAYQEEEGIEHEDGNDFTGNLGEPMPN